MQIKAKLLEGPSLLEWSGSLYTNTLAIGSPPCILLYDHIFVSAPLATQTDRKGMHSPTNREARLLEHHCPGGKWDTSGVGGSAGLAIALRKMKRGDVFLKITPIPLFWLCLSLWWRRVQFKFIVASFKSSRV